MAEEIYTYSILNDFPGSPFGRVNEPVLREEILSSSISSTLIRISREDDVLSIVFDPILSSGDKTVLDGDTDNPAGGLIAVHDADSTSATPNEIVLDKDLNTPPVSPSLGDKYIVSSSATGLWTGKEDRVARWNGSEWDIQKPEEGNIFWISDEMLHYKYNNVFPNGSWVLLSSVGTGDVTSTLSMPDNEIIRGDGGAKGIQGSKWQIADDGKLNIDASRSGYLLDLHNTNGGSGGGGILVRAGEETGDVTLRLCDQDGSTELVDFEANGHTTFGKTYSSTVTANGNAFGVDNQHSAGETADFNTQNGLYRIGGKPVIRGTYYQYAENESQHSTTSTNYQVALTFNTPSLPSGTYRVGFSTEASVASSGKLSNIEFKVGATVVNEMSMESDNDWLTYDSFKHMTLSGVNTIKISHKMTTTYSTSKLRRSRIEFWRIS